MQVELNDDLSEAGPTIMTLEPGALADFSIHHLNLKIAAAALEDVYLRGHWNKLDTYTMRFAIILELFKWSLGRGSDKVISAETMSAAIALTDWHQYESLRVYTYLAAKSAVTRKQGKKN